MGMLKTAMRLAVQFRQIPVATLESVDRVLPDLKEREMFATLALLRFDGPAKPNTPWPAIRRSSIIGTAAVTRSGSRWSSFRWD